MRSYLSLFSSETVNFLRPLALLVLNTLLPLAVLMRLRKPCLLDLFLLDGWNVRFIVYQYLQLFQFLRVQM